jgi:predicted Zn-dependent peptidase
LTAIALAVHAGARFDGSHPGLAHMAEHMLFQGTESLDQLALNLRAAELGGEHNADTGHEDIAMTFEVFNEDVDAAMALLAEQFYRTRVDRGRFLKERRVVLDEIRGRADDSADYVHTQAWNRFFRGALAHPVWGSVGSLQRMQPSDVTRFLRRNFVRRRAVLAVSGGISRAALHRAVSRHFHQGNGRQAGAIPPSAPGQAGLVRLRRRNGNQAYVVRMIDLPRQPRQLIAVGIALDLVGSDPDSHLFQAVRERHGLGYDVSATVEWGSDWAVAVLAASGTRGQADRLVRVIDETCERAASEGFKSDELARARKKLRYRYASLSESRIDRALALAEGALSGFPPPHEAQRLVDQTSHAQVERAWRAAVRRRTLTAVLDG